MTTNTHQCRVCGSADLQTMFAIGDCALERCHLCQFAQVAEEPSPAVLNELYSGSYFDKGKYDDDDNQRRENRRRLALLKRIGVAPGSKVLDAGCATGDFIAAAEGYEMWGVDVSEDAIATARRANPTAAERISAAPVDELPFSPGSFDAVVLWDVIEHLWDPRAACHRLSELLRPGGCLVLSTPDIGALTARLMGRRWAFMTPPEHLGFFSPPSFAWLLEKELGMTTILSFAAGKWVNAGFLSYKLQRVFPDLVPKSLVTLVQSSPLARLPLYVPTQDIRYIAARKN
jgi:SAM-dependent methyltransferase